MRHNTDQPLSQDAFLPAKCNGSQRCPMDDFDAVFEARKRDKNAFILELLMSILTAGLYYVLKETYPSLRIWLTTSKSTLDLCDLVVCRNSFGQITLAPVRTLGCGGMEIFESLPGLEQIRVFQYKCIRFLFDPRQNLFIPSNQLVDISQTPLGEALAGVSRTEHAERILLLGKNLIEIPVPSIVRLLHAEVLQPMNVFQFLSFVVWMIQSYWKYAVVILIITLISIVLTVRDMRRSMNSIRKMSEMDMDVYVSRSGTWRVVPYEDLVPGDVFELVATMTVVPCDAVLLDGDCIIDESMLTGESVPVSKNAPEDDDDWEQINFSHLESSRSTKSILFCGTRVIRVRGTHSRPAIAMVARTGFFTAKGSLIRSILYPKPSRFKFYQESINFIKILGLVAIVGFIVVICATYRHGLSAWNIFQRATDLITIVVPPALPAAMAVATELALRRLRKQRVFCISPPKINVAGKLNLICFDKTGTLTEEGLDVMGICTFDGKLLSDEHVSSQVDPEHRPNLIDSNQKLNQNYPMVMLALATCHSIKCVNDEFIGDPLDLKMFEWTKWILEESSCATNSVVSCIVRPPWTSEFDVDEFLYPEETEEELSTEGIANSLSDNSLIEQAKNAASPVANLTDSNEHLEYGIIRCFDFVAQLRRMSVIVKELNGTDLIVFTKGSPESIKSLLNPDSIPSNFQARLDYFTQSGYRVIALAHRTISNLSWVQAQKISRADVECQLDFLGFLVFENKIKPVTKGILATLKNANIRTLMCTGDNTLTAISVSKECGILSDREESLVFTSRLDAATRLVEWQCANSPDYSLDPVSLKLMYLGQEADQNIAPSMDVSISTLDDCSSRISKSVRFAAGDLPCKSIKYELACSGEAFDHLCKENPTVFERLLVKCQIFARMNPEQKQFLVESLQRLGYSVGFCGDGANDCGALKAADVGISLSEAEASVAAPFTSNINDIGCVLKVLREGRCSLQTSFSCFKFMSLYVFVQFTTTILMNFRVFRLGDNQFLYIDLVLTLLVAFANDSFKASKLLTKKQPHSKLLSLRYLSELAAHLVLIFSLQLGVFLWSIRRDPSTMALSDDDTSDLVTRMFLFSIFQYLIVGLVSCPGKPFRQPVYTHWLYCLTMVTELGMNMLLLFCRWPRLITFFGVTNISMNDRLIIGMLAILHAAVALVIEWILLPLWVGLINRLFHHRRSVRQYQSLEQTFKDPFSNPNKRLHV